MDNHTLSFEIDFFLCGVFWGDSSGKAFGLGAILMFCKVVFDKIVHLASWEDTQFGGVFNFWNGNLLLPEHLWYPLCSELSWSNHFVVQIASRPWMNVEEKISTCYFHEIVCEG